MHQRETINPSKKTFEHKNINYTNEQRRWNCKCAVANFLNANVRRGWNVKGPFWHNRLWNPLFSIAYTMPQQLSAASSTAAHRWTPSPQRAMTAQRSSWHRVLSERPWREESIIHPQRPWIQAIFKSSQSNMSHRLSGCSRGIVSHARSQQFTFKLLWGHCRMRTVQ